MTIEQNPHGPETLIGDPDDPILASDLDALDGHEAQDAEYDRAHAADVMLECFFAGVRASDAAGSFGIDDPAYALGETVGWLIRGQIALKPELAPLWDALVKS